MNKLLVGALVITGMVFGLLFWLAWVVLEKFGPGQVQFWATLVTAGGPFMVLGAYALGFYLGKVESRGALSGIDQATERIARVVGQTVNVRDASRIRVQNQMPQSGAPIVLFPMSDRPQITHRGGGNLDANEIIDLSE